MNALERKQLMTEATEIMIARRTQREGIQIALQIARKKIFLAANGRCLPQEQPIGTQGGLEGASTSLINLSMRVSNPAPATNPNADCYDQVHVHPKGRWT